MRPVGIGAMKADIVVPVVRVVPVVTVGGVVGERGTSEGAWDGLYWNIRCKGCSQPCHCQSKRHVALEEGW